MIDCWQKQLIAFSVNILSNWASWVHYIFRCFPIVNLSNFVVTILLINGHVKNNKYNNNYFFTEVFFRFIFNFREIAIYRYIIQLPARRNFSDFANENNLATSFFGNLILSRVQSKYEQGLQQNKDDNIHKKRKL